MRFWLAASFLLVFAAGAAVGVLASRYLPRETSAATPPSVPLQEIYSDVPPYLVTSEEIYERLALDVGQRKAVDSLVKRHYSRASEIRASLDELSRDLGEGVLAVLTPGQQERWDRVQKDYADREIQGQVLHAMMQLRFELAFSAEQEPGIYQVLYDHERERRDVWRKAHEERRDRRELRDEFEKLTDRRDAQLKEILTAEQAAKYEERRERERRWFSEQRDRFKKRRPEPKAGGERGAWEPPPAPPRPEPDRGAGEAEEPPPPASGPVRDDEDGSTSRRARDTSGGTAPEAC